MACSLWRPLRIAGGAFAIVAALAAVAALAQQGPPAVSVSVAEPLAKRITQWDEYSGRFEAVETVEVRPRVSGFIEKLHFKDGQLVKAGDPLFTLERRSFEIAVESAQAEIARTTAQVDLQENEVERATPLARSGTVTKRDLDQRSANLLVARAQLQAAQAGLKSAELNLEWTEVRAPISGRISDRKVDVGNLVTGGTAGATQLTTIVSLDPIHFIFEVSEADFLRYSRLFLSGERASSRDAANPVRIKLADEPNWPHTGKMDFVDNQLNPRSGTLRGRALIDNKNQLLQPGLFGRLQLWGGEADALLIPDSAVVSDQARKIVFAVGADNAVKGQPVELGPMIDGLRVVRSGLKPQDKIVIDGLANPMVRPGAKVAPQAGQIKAATN
jgi:membrane fusion protein, multidrug efflux system